MIKLRFTSFLSLSFFLCVRGRRELEINIWSEGLGQILPTHLHSISNQRELPRPRNFRWVHCRVSSQIQVKPFFTRFEKAVGDPLVP